MLCLREGAVSVSVASPWLFEAVADLKLKHDSPWGFCFPAVAAVSMIANNTAETCFAKQPRLTAVCYGSRGCRLLLLVLFAVVLCVMRCACYVLCS